MGRNESGKSNLLRALYSLKPVEGFKALKPIKDFPRHRQPEECRDDELRALQYAFQKTEQWFLEYRHLRSDAREPW